MTVEREEEMKKKILYLAFDKATVADIKWILEDLNLDFEIEAIQTLPQLADTLLEEKERIILIVTDTFLPAVKDLAPIGKPEISTLDGFQAGFVILEHFLRQKDSSYKNIPVLILTAKILTKKEKELVQKLKVEYIELFRSGWRRRFKKFITRLSLK